MESHRFLSAIVFQKGNKPRKSMVFDEYQKALYLFHANQRSTPVNLFKEIPIRHNITEHRKAVSFRVSG